MSNATTGPASDDDAQVRLHQSPECNLIAVFLNLMTKHLLIVARQ